MASTVEAVPAAGPRGKGRFRHTVIVLGALLLAAFALALGMEYYRLPLEQRPFSPLYEQFRPAGHIGLRYGIIGTTLIGMGVLLYSSRKRFGFLRRAGKLKYWLEFHILVCSVGPFLILLHTSFKVGGLVSIAFWSMTVVALSGIFGRYVYVRIPKTVQGQFANLGQVQQERQALLTSLAAQLGPRFDEVQRLMSGIHRHPVHGFLGAIAGAVRFDLARRGTLRRVRRLISGSGLPATARRSVVDVVEEQLRIEQQLALLAPFQKLFRYWHLFHLPLAIVMFVIVTVHVVVASMFGYGVPR